MKYLLVAMFFFGLGLKTMDWAVKWDMRHSTPLKSDGHGPVEIDLNGPGDLCDGRPCAVPDIDTAQVKMKDNNYPATITTSYAPCATEGIGATYAEHKVIWGFCPDFCTVSVFGIDHTPLTLYSDERMKTAMPNPFISNLDGGYRVYTNSLGKRVVVWEIGGAVTFPYGEPAEWKRGNK